MVHLNALKKSFKNLALLMLFAAFHSPVRAEDAADFAIFGAEDVSVDTYSVVRGDVYSGRNLTVEFGHGIQRKSLNSGSMFAYENYTQESLSEVNGNVFANGDTTFNGTSRVFGSVTHGGVFSASASSNVSGTVQQQPSVVRQLSIPDASQFSAGSNDVISDESVTLAPGAYRDLEMRGLFDQITLTSGNYYFRDLDFQTGTTISLQLAYNQPINVFLAGNADFGTGLRFLVNDVEVGTASSDSIAELARLVTFESHGDVTIPGGFLNEFFGTIFTPFGDIDVDLQDMHGSIISGRDVSAAVYLDHQPSNYLFVSAVPEPSTFAFSMLLAGACITRRQRRLATGNRMNSRLTN